MPQYCTMKLLTQHLKTQRGICLLFLVVWLLPGHKDIIVCEKRKWQVFVSCDSIMCFSLNKLLKYLQF